MHVMYLNTVISLIVSLSLFYSLATATAHHAPVGVSEKHQVDGRAQQKHVDHHHHDEPRHGALLVLLSPASGFPSENGDGPPEESLVQRPRKHGLRADPCLVIALGRCQRIQTLPTVTSWVVVVWQSGGAVLAGSQGYGMFQPQPRPPSCSTGSLFGWTGTIIYLLRLLRENRCDARETLRNVWTSLPPLSPWCRAWRATSSVLHACFTPLFSCC